MFHPSNPIAPCTLCSPFWLSSSAGVQPPDAKSDTLLGAMVSQCSEGHTCRGKSTGGKTWYLPSLIVTYH